MKPEKFSIYVDNSNREEIKRIAYENGMETYKSIFNCIVEFCDNSLYYWNGKEWDHCCYIPEDTPTITLDQFREYYGKKKIKGYAAPFDMVNGQIKKGSVFTPDDSLYYSFEGEMILKEIVETWQPIYEEEEKVFYIGDQKKEVKVSRGNVIICGNKITIDGLKKGCNATQYYSETTITVELTDATYTINGVTGITLSEIKQIIQEYNKLNK